MALFLSNAKQLRAVLEQGPSSQYYSMLVTLISISLLLQVATGILLVLIGEELRPGVSPSAPMVEGKLQVPPCSTLHLHTLAS